MYNLVCRLNDRELKFARTVIFTVKEINRNAELLPGVTLGYRLYNGCGSENLIRAALEAVNGGNPKSCSSQIQALLGHSSSGVSEDINIMLSPLSIPQVRKKSWKITENCYIFIVPLVYFSSLTSMFFIVMDLFFEGEPSFNMCLFE